MADFFISNVKYYFETIKKFQQKDFEFDQKNQILLNAKIQYLKIVCMKNCLVYLTLRG